MSDNTLNNILDPSYFEEDINSFKEQQKKNETLYDEVHELYNKIRGEDDSLNFKGIRDLSEVAKTLASIRSTSIEATNKLFQAKTAIVNIEIKKKTGAEDNKTNADMARSIVALIRNEVKGPLENKAPTADDATALDARVETSLKDGKIKISKNDEAMKYAQKHINFVYDTRKKEILAQLDDGTIVTDYPKSRIPSGKIVAQSETDVTLSTGIRIKKMQ